jgi:hypothetical protein
LALYDRLRRPPSTAKPPRRRVKPLINPAGSISGVEAAPGGVIPDEVDEVVAEDDDEDVVQCTVARVLPKSLWTMLALAAVAVTNEAASTIASLLTALSLTLQT